LKTREIFDKYATPSIQINAGATDVTVISIVDGVMKMKGEVVHPVPVITDIAQWITWLENTNIVCLYSV